MRSIRKISAVSATLAACALLPTQAIAASVWDHNGSSMRLEEQGKKRKFVYDQPSRNLTAAGVKQGTVLFEGEEKTDGRLAGYAKLFRKGCDPVDYFVEGALDKTKGEILLQGQAPVYSGQACKITGYSEDGSASSLAFTYRSGGGANIARGDDLGPDPRGERDAYRTDPTSRTAPLDRYGRDRAYDSPPSRRAYDDPRYAPEDAAPRSAPSDAQYPRYGSRDSQDPLAAPRDGQNPRYGSRDSQDPLAAPRDGQNPRYGSRDGQDPLAAPRDGQNPRYGSRDSQDPLAAPRDGQNPRYGSRDGQNPRYGSRYGQEPLYPPEDVGPRSPRDSADPRYAPRDYADRSNRDPSYRRYEGNFYAPRHPRAEPDETDLDDDDNEPAYIPYQPFWRRWRGY